MCIITEAIKPQAKANNAKPNNPSFCKSQKLILNLNGIALSIHFFSKVTVLFFILFDLRLYL